MSRKNVAPPSATKAGGLYCRNAVVSLGFSSHGAAGMRNFAGQIVVTSMIFAGAVSAAAAQENSVVVAHPTYTSIPMEITVNRPAAAVWGRIGKYCDVAEWLQIAAGCKILSGKDGEVGAVRSVG